MPATPVRLILFAGQHHLSPHHGAEDALSYVVAIAALVCWSLLALTLHLNGIWLGAGVLAVMVALAGTGRAE